MRNSATIVLAVALLGALPVSAAGLTLLVQPPDQSGYSTSDETCAIDFTTRRAEDFVLAQETSISEITIWVVYDINVPPAADDLTVTFHDDDGGLPGPISNGGTAVVVNPPQTRIATGMIAGNRLEFEIRMDITGVSLESGSYWVEIVNDTPVDNCMGWATGLWDQVNSMDDSALEGGPFNDPWAASIFDNAIIMIGCITPLFVELEHFTAEWTRDGVDLNWRTASEKDNVGFRIVREHITSGARQKAEEIQIHAGLIPAQGTELVGAEYRLLDDANLSPGTYRYHLEDIDLLGVVTRHEAATVVIPSRTRQR